MQTNQFTRNTTWLLCFAAGFCDTLTFVSAGEIFSAHVTGNFIVFAYDLNKHSDAHGWEKLLTFPVFVLSVMLGGYIAGKSVNKNTLLVLESFLLITSGMLALVLPDQVPLIVLLIVVAMAFQNTFGKLYNQSTYGLTTVMTGNVTQASLDLIKGLITNSADSEIWISFKKQLTLIAGFLLGCLAGAVMAGQFGLVAVWLPGALMAIWLILAKRQSV